MTWFQNAMGPYTILEKVNNSVLGFINAASNLLFIMNFRTKRLLANNSQFRTLEETCFILGNGPSLKSFNFDSLRGKDYFTVNYFFKYKSEVHPKFFLAVDHTFYTGDGWVYLKHAYATHPKTIFIIKKEAYDKEPDYWDLSRTILLNAKQFQYGAFVQTDCTKNMTAVVNVVLQCIQVAMFLGYKKIFLLGCDFNHFTTTKENHFYSSENKEDLVANYLGVDLKWSSYAMFHHYALQLEALKRGIEIINLTPRSLIDAYPRDCVENVLAISSLQG